MGMVAAGNFALQALHEVMAGRASL